MLVLKTAIRSPVGLHFSPCGAGLLVFSGSVVQVWRDWLNEPARPAVKTGSALERAALGPGAAHAVLYLSGNSRTKLFGVATGKVSETVVPNGGPAWPHCGTGGAFVISSHSRGKLSRFDYDPDHKDVLREVWQIDRRGGKGGKSHIGTHYRFGDVCGAAGVFVGLEYRHGGSEPFDALAVRAVADGALVSREVLKAPEYNRLLSKAGLTLSIHPSGRYFAHPDGKTVCFRKLSGKAPDPVELPVLVAPAPKRKPKPKPNATAAPPKAKPAAPKRACESVAFSPNGAFLLAGRSDGAVTLFDTNTWEPVRTLDWRVGPLRAVQFAPDGTRAAAVGTKGKVVVWDVDV
jgi:hypothetical protein